MTNHVSRVKVETTMAAETRYRLIVPAEVGSDFNLVDLEEAIGWLRNTLGLSRDLMVRLEQVDAARRSGTETYDALHISAWHKRETGGGPATPIEWAKND